MRRDTRGTGGHRHHEDRRAQRGDRKRHQEDRKEQRGDQSSHTDPTPAATAVTVQYITVTLERAIVSVGGMAVTVTGAYSRYNLYL
jgi:hypothetical protein